MRLVTMALGLVLLANPLRAGDVAIDELVTEAKAHVHEYNLGPEDSISGVIDRFLSSATGSDDLVAFVGERFGLRDETARLMVVGELRRLMADDAADQTGEDTQRIRLAVEEQFALALRGDPSNPAVAREYLVMIATAPGTHPDAADRIRGVLRGISSEQRGLVALRVMNDPRVRVTDGAVGEAVIESFGLDPLALSIIAENLPNNGEAELFDRASELWLTQNDINSASVAAGRAIYAYANRRSLDDVLRLYRRLSPQAKAFLSKEPASEVTVRSRGVERRIGTRDVRLTLAAAFVLGGDSRSARMFLPEAKLSPVDSSVEAKRENESSAAMRAVIMAGIDPPSGDAFDLVTNYLLQVNEKVTGLVDELFDRVATRAGYSAVSKWRLEQLDQSIEWLRRQQEGVPVPKAMAALIHPTPARASSDEQISSGFARLLEAKRLVPFVERPVDETVRAIPLRCDVLAELRGSGVTFPRGFHPLRAEAYGDEIVAVGASQDLDPVGEISDGGYWIVRSADRGASWNPPLYTGLRAMQPYDLVIGSTVPLVLPDGVRLEVVVNELDEESITFPPINLRTKRTKAGITLDFSWQELERDSDGDGLTDLMEERIFTDPNVADSDGDGLPDGVDPLPQVAFRRSAGSEAGVVEAVLEAYYGPAIRVDPSRVAQEASSCDITALSRMGERTIFLVGNPSDFAGVQTAVRTVVLSQAELDAASRKFGRILATHMSPIVIDQTGTRAWVKIDDEWRGATFMLEKKDGVWIALDVASWIT